jgi:pyruvate dehydrogenase E2 component (dihydrolipoamide acetyltransferase)
MAIKILMPALSPTMTEGNLARWVKQEGDKVSPGQVLAEIETDKAVMEVEAADSGILAKILIDGGAQGVKVNELIAVLIEPGEEVIDAEKLIAEHQVQSVQQPEGKEQSSVISAEQKELPSMERNPVVAVGKIVATPLAHRVAAERGVKLQSVVGTGPGGRIIKVDVLNYAAHDSGAMKMRSAVESRLIPLTQMRKTIAKRLQESKISAPHFYLNMQCDMTQLVAAREYLNAKAKIADGKPEYKISINDFVIKATAMALAKHPDVNAGWSDEGIVMYNNVDISVAVATEDGLITPIVQNADHKSLQQISQQVKVLAQKARNNQLKPQEFIGGSFTISNLGMYGVEEFYAIINPPQAGIMAIGVMQKMPVVKGDAVVIADVVKITLSFDHRVIDGAVAGQFLADLKAHIEQPFTMFL